ncbi:MAG: hypothetical protein ABIF10_06125 [Candidatus Woesearchaeota archaeon]
MEEIYLEERELPYRIQLSPDEPDCMCNGKCIRLRNKLVSSGLEVRFRVCGFLWSEQKIPEESKLLLQEDQDFHVYLEVRTGSGWHALDPTFDSRLLEALAANGWPQDSIAFLPNIIFGTGESEEMMLESAEYDWETNRSFYTALNSWFDNLRKPVLVVSASQ